MSIYVSATELLDDIYHGKQQTVLASFWAPGEDGGRSQYLQRHLPTALFCDPVAALSGIPGSGAGRNPLPEQYRLQEWFDRWGLTQGRRVVVYDQGDGLLAARAWWVLCWAGVEKVQILDGGLAAWEAIKRPIVGGPGNFTAVSDAKVTPGQMKSATMDEVREHRSNGGTLVDFREERRFAGYRELLDLRAGHIPGAVNVPARDLQKEKSLLRSPEEIRERFARAGVHSGDNVIAYSGSGNHSALGLAAMEVAGLTGATHFMGGWSQWAADKSNPVQHGV